MIESKELFQILCNILSATREMPAQAIIYETAKIYGWVPDKIDEEVQRLSQVRSKAGKSYPSPYIFSRA